MGPGGRGCSKSGRGQSGENVVAIIEMSMTGGRSRAGTSARRRRSTRDYRRMLEKEKLDAIVVSTADHTHAHASITGCGKDCTATAKSR